VSSLEEREKLRDYLRRGLMRSAAIALALLLLIPLAEPFILLTYGADFAQAVVFFRLLVGVMIFDVLLTPLLLLPLAYRQPKLLAAADGARAVTLVVVAIGLIPVFGAFGAIAARFAARVAGAALVLGVLYAGSGRQSLEVQHKEASGVLE
jgi:O-antigen/teichoic acid export membrane protein